METQNNEGLPYDPSQDGFVFSNAARPRFSTRLTRQPSCLNLSIFSVEVGSSMGTPGFEMLPLLKSRFQNEWLGGSYDEMFEAEWLLPLGGLGSRASHSAAPYCKKTSTVPPTPL